MGKILPYLTKFHLLLKLHTLILLYLAIRENNRACLMILSFYFLILTLALVLGVWGVPFRLIHFIEPLLALLWSNIHNCIFSGLFWWTLVWEWSDWLRWAHYFRFWWRILLNSVWAIVSLNLKEAIACIEIVINKSTVLPLSCRERVVPVYETSETSVDLLHFNQKLSRNGFLKRLIFIANRLPHLFNKVFFVSVVFLNCSLKELFGGLAVSTYLLEGLISLQVFLKRLVFNSP